MDNIFWLLPKNRKKEAKHMLLANAVASYHLQWGYTVLSVGVNPHVVLMD